MELNAILTLSDFNSHIIDISKRQHEAKDGVTGCIAFNT